MIYISKRIISYDEALEFADYFYYNSEIDRMCLILSPEDVYYEIDNFPGYFINEFGDVISTYNCNIRVMKPYSNKHGHKYVDLRDSNGARHKCIIHRLMASTFLSNPNHYPVVRHLDDDPENNDILNLAWGTQKDNVEDCRSNGHMFMKPVYCYELDHIYQSCAEAAKDLGVSKSSITLCCRGKIKSVCGYHLSYWEDIYE